MVPKFVDADALKQKVDLPAMRGNDNSDPYIKLLVTGLNFFILYLLNVSKHT